jgi:hypothetical protein
MAGSGGSAKQRHGRTRELAAYLKKKGIERLTGQCPWGCGRPIKNGGEDLLSHLNLCRGNPKKDRRYRTR